jgi:hypothetical protein
MLTTQIIKLNHDIHINCDCEKDTDSDSEQGACREEMLKKILENFDETTETDEQEESKTGENLEHAVQDVSEIVEGYKQAMSYQSSEANAEFSPTKKIK